MDALTSDSSRRIDELLNHYAQSHQHPLNERIHFVAIPLIMLSLIGLMFSLSSLLAYGFVLASMVYYLRLSVPFTVAMGRGLSSCFLWCMPWEINVYHGA